VISYLTRRFVPPPERFAMLKQHVVAQGDRLDNLAAKYSTTRCSGGAWRCHRALRPQDLTDTIGRQLRITLPDGVPLARENLMLDGGIHLSLMIGPGMPMRCRMT